MRQAGAGERAPAGPGSAGRATSTTVWPYVHTAATGSTGMPHAPWQAAAHTQPRRTNTWHRSPPCPLIAGPVCGRRHLPAANWRPWRPIRAILARSPRPAPALAFCATRPIVALRPRSAMPLTAGTSRLRGRRWNRSVETSPLRRLRRVRPARFVRHALVRGACFPTPHHHSRRCQPRSSWPFNLRLTSGSEQGRRALCPARWVRITTWDEVGGDSILIASPGRGKRAARDLSHPSANLSWQRRAWARTPHRPAILRK